MSKMYAGVKTWSPFIGCEFNCNYCVPSFQHMQRRVVSMQNATGHGDFQNCSKCLRFFPHEHPNILEKFPSKGQGGIVWPGAHGDISFTDLSYVKRIIDITDCHPDRTYYWQSKNPCFFSKIIPFLSENSILLTTLETNRDTGYSLISKAPVPSKRAADFLNLQWDRKIVTIEPVMDFDLDEFSRLIIDICPEQVWIGYNSRRNPVLPEPSSDNFQALVMNLLYEGIWVKIKSLQAGRNDQENVRMKEILEKIGLENDRK
jgi:hypothetical protein